MSRFAVIDLANLFFRCQYSVRGDAFTKAGMALHIVFNSLRKLHREMKVDHMVFCTEGKSWRYSVYPAYKAKRKLDRQLKTEAEKEEDEVFLSVLEDFTNFIAEKTHCTLLKSDGIEGDDFVARWIQLHPNDEHIILSGDTDFFQLLAPNVTIVDGVQERIIRTDGVTDFKGNAMVFEVDPSKGRLKIGKTIMEARKAFEKEQNEAHKKHVAAEKDKAARHKAFQAEKVAADPSYKPVPYVAAPFEEKEFTFEPEAEWWRKALFIKIVRGDAGDGIFSSYPGVLYKGSAKKTGILQAWEDRNESGYHWNNFMLQRWEKLVGKDEDGNSVTKEVRVLDEFKFNEMLIDLTKQPDEIKNLMDTVIIQAVQKDSVSNVGVNFLKFCKAHALVNLTRDAADHAAYLNAKYTS